MAIPARYTRTAIFFHWLIALLVIGNFLIGQFVEAFGDDNVRFMINTHKSIGITVLGLAIMRLLWRWTHTPPAYPVHYKRWETRAAHWVHVLLYVLLFTLPITGWLLDSAWKAAPEVKMFWFGLFEWPRIGWIMNIEPLFKERLHDIFGGVHEIAGKILLALFVFHVAGALKHQWFDKQPELQRMLP